MEYKSLLAILSIFYKLASSAAVEPEIQGGSPCCKSKMEAPMCHDMGCSGVFVNSYKLRIIFDWWLCEKGWQYALTLVGLFGFAAMSPCLKAYREIIRNKVIKTYICDCLLTHFLLFVFALAVYILDFLLMLIVMSFNVGVFFAITTGYALGYLVSAMAYANYKSSSRSQSFSQINEDCC
ncbi:surface protein [Theileria orientalis strain Shintoku]|uniref:Copper transport protein n=1 Tax=Theileria orientalis strain Shintoku TaxID=869250 RepID=J7M4T8_THEOR|nr:surface protein [Theileria orientalis strain Shintoku]PVC49819.1 surface protein [Theileria orientalis]BAM42515.1 surface protein [Theileria orientalis strain Shintoku]|eukprot:XP_009692816.1 surface protein [Theileria orientalis strain Shintoku]